MARGWVVSMFGDHVSVRQVDFVREEGDSDESEGGH
jgi:hypothetical protein